MATYQARFFHDWGSGTWLWSADDTTRSAFDYPIDHATIGLPEALVAELDRLAGWHDTNLNWDDPVAPGRWRAAECDEYNAAVARALVQLRAWLGAEWEIVDEAAPEREDPDLDRYLADPRGFERG